MSSKKDEKPFWEQGLDFSCRSCGHCCRHEPGYVFLSETDLLKLARHRNMSTEKFTDKYCRTVDLGITTRLSLRETESFDCIFWDRGCTVYEARPLQCRTYPFWPAILSSPEEWENEAKECPGINSGKHHSAREISRALKKREREVLISPSR
jgi:Fe-S-cluster containining protein